MKKTTAFLLSIAFGLVAMAQTTARLTNIKDAFGSICTYVGEVKNGSPNGLGLALYPSGNTASYYAGYFVNGQYSGRGCMLFTSGAFLSGNWKNGKLFGKGAYLDKDGGLYVGDYVAGDKAGNGTFFYKDNSFLSGQYVADQFSGRCIFIPSSGQTLTDNFYKKGKKDGFGYQYEASDKKMFEGQWANGEWVRSAPVPYNSFIKGATFYAEKTANQIIMGGVNKVRKNSIHDTAFYYNLKEKKRYFGVFDNGFLATGIIIKDDSSRFIGTLTKGGAQGPGSFMKIGKFYDEGNYLNDYLTGPDNTSIGLVNKTVY